MSTEQVDSERVRTPRPFDRDTHFTGQDYTKEDEAALGASAPPGGVAAAPREGDAALPPDNGKRASFDPATGAVRGSGVGAGGGQAGEDLDQDSATGDGPIETGVGVGKR